MFRRSGTQLFSTHSRDIACLGRVRRHGWEVQKVVNVRDSDLFLMLLSRIRDWFSLASFAVVWFAVLVPGTWYEVPGTNLVWYQVPGTRYQVPVPCHDDFSSDAILCFCQPSRNPMMWFVILDSE